MSGMDADNMHKITELPAWERLFKRIVTYQSSRQSSNHAKVHSGNDVSNYKSRYGKGIRSIYTVLQIKADSPVNGAEVFR